MDADSILSGELGGVKLSSSYSTESLLSGLTSITDYFAKRQEREDNCSASGISINCDFPSISQKESTPKKYTKASRIIVRKQGYPGERISSVPCKPNRKVSRVYPSVEKSAKADERCQSGFQSQTPSTTTSALYLDVADGDEIPAIADIRRKVSRKCQSANSNSTQSTSSPGNDEDEFNKYTPWEKWILEKEAARLRELEKESLKKSVQAEHRENEEKKRRQRAELFEIRFSEWKKSKWIEKKCQERQDAESMMRRQLLEESMKEKIKIKSEEKYKMWLASKNKEAKLHEALIEMANSEEAKMRQKKEGSSQEAFKKWKSNTSKFKPRSPYSRGYADGQEIRYYDRTAYPDPSFCNKKSWIV